MQLFICPAGGVCIGSLLHWWLHQLCSSFNRFELTSRHITGICYVRWYDCNGEFTLQPCNSHYRTLRKVLNQLMFRSQSAIVQCSKIKLAGTILWQSSHLHFQLAGLIFHSQTRTASVRLGDRWCLNCLPCSFLWSNLGHMCWDMHVQLESAMKVVVGCHIFVQQHFWGSQLVMSFQAGYLAIISAWPVPSSDAESSAALERLDHSKAGAKLLSS